MMEMKLAEIEMRYTEAKNKKEQIGILADLNGVESTFMAMLLREMGLDVAAEKLPRKPRNGGADGYELFKLTQECADAVKWREEHGREIGRAIGYTADGSRSKKSTVEAELPKKERDTNLGDRMRLAIYMWGSYLEYTHGQTITRDDVAMLERLLEMTAG